MDPYRLPRTVLPNRYELILTPDLQRGCFTGQVRITIDVQTPVAEIWLNAIDLTFTLARYKKGSMEQDARVEVYPAMQRCRFAFSQPLPLGPAELILEYSALLNDRLCGFYRSRVQGADGKEHWLAATQFEATDARRAFPCWDEPNFKAVFSVTLIVSAGLIALSNTRVVDDQMLNGKRLMRFADTIPLSTYLVAFIIGPLESTEAVHVGSTPIRVWCVPGKKHLARFALDAATFSLAFFEEYYDRPYPSDKLDLIALPDFAAGAMENLGAITFRETTLLLDPDTATFQEKQRVADVVMHENAHLWFGDLVTMHWWNGLWLNEAFATFLELLAVDGWRPEWQRWSSFSLSRSAALQVDGLLSSRAVEYPVASPDDAEAMFDVLTYDKGASVLRMLEQYIGPEVFRRGVRLYLQRHAFGNADTADLWNALEEASSVPIPLIMQEWVFQPGYPLIRVARQGTQLVLSQQRFCYLPRRDATTHCWQVPVQLRIETSRRNFPVCMLLDRSQRTLELPPDTQMVLVNAGGHGYYRVGYTAEWMNEVLDRWATLSAIERYNFVADAWALVLAGQHELPTFLTWLKLFCQDRDPTIWSLLMNLFSVLSRIVVEADRPALQSLIRDLLRPMLRQLRWYPRAGEDELTGQLRGDLLRFAGTLGDDATVQAEALLIYGGHQASAAVAAAVIDILAYVGDSNRYEDYLSRFRTAATPQLRQRYLLALAYFRPDELVQRTLQLVLDGTVRMQDAPLLLRALLQGVSSRSRAWIFVQQHWNELVHRFTGPGIRRLCEGLLGLTSRQWEQEVLAFVRDRQIRLGGKLLEQFLEQLHISVLFREREEERLRQYLQERMKP